MPHVILHQLLETEDSLELGEAIGEVYVGQDGLEVAVEDDSLRDRLESLLAEPLTTNAAAPGTLGTMRVVLAPQDAGYLPALEERLRKPDFRLAVEVLSEE
ncbi:hypothetical protein DYH09_05805 [bacterium CPR1]|nr:hypothetical protein [bacterium CPR1]